MLIYLSLNKACIPHQGRPEWSINESAAGWNALANNTVISPTLLTSRISMIGRIIIGLLNSLTFLFLKLYFSFILVFLYLSPVWTSFSLLLFVFDLCFSLLGFWWENLCVKYVWGGKEGRKEGQLRATSPFACYQTFYYVDGTCVL